MFRALEIYNFGGLSHATDFYDMPICTLFDVFDNQEGVAIEVGFFFHNKNEGSYIVTIWIHMEKGAYICN